MTMNLYVFQEPRGMMRIVQFIFAIWAFSETVAFVNHVTLTYCEPEKSSTTIEFRYPFDLDKISVDLHNCSDRKETFRLLGDFSSDAEFFVATGCLSMLYCVGVSIMYLMSGNLYQTNPMVPKADFVATLLLAVFWLSGSAAWANGFLGMQSLVDPDNIRNWPTCKKVKCSASVGNFVGLKTSVTLGFLNFFLWGSDLWFLYKETQWFKNPNQNQASRTGTTPA